MQNTERIPLKRCKKCRHYTFHCPLLDLEPCSFVPIDESYRERDWPRIIATIIVTLAICAGILLACK